MLNESDDVAIYMSNFTEAYAKAVEIFASGQMEKRSLLLVRPISPGATRLHCHSEGERQEHRKEDNLCDNY